MELILRSAAVLLLSALTALLLKKNAPELALMLSLAALCTVFLSLLNVIRQFRSLFDTVSILLPDSEIMIRPVLKCLAIAVITKITAELCQDASQNTASAAIELIGTVCALSVAMPLIVSMIKSVGGLI